MISLAQIVTGLTNQLRSIDGLHLDDFVPSNPQFPAAFVFIPTDAYVDYRQTFGKGYIILDLEVVVLIGAGIDRQQKDLFDYIDWSGPKSIVAAVDVDKTLGLTGIEAVAMSARSLAAEEVASYSAWGAAVRFHIGSTTA